MTDQCACGQKLHYDDPKKQITVEGIIHDLGATVRIEYRGRAWGFQRHFVALHGLPKGDNIPTIAGQYDFKEIKPIDKKYNTGPKKRNQPINKRPAR